MELQNIGSQISSLTAKKLREFLESKDLGVRVRLAEDISSSANVLLELSHDPDPEVRACVACNPSTPAYIVKMLCEDLHDDVRYAMASDPHLPVAVLYKLAEDHNPYVCDRAQKTIEGMSLELALEESAFKSFPGQRARLGDLLVAAKVLDEKEIEQYVLDAQTMQVPLGRALIHAGRIDRRIVIYALKFQTLIRLGQATLEAAIVQISEYASAQQACE